MTDLPGDVGLPAAPGLREVLHDGARLRGMYTRVWNGKHGGWWDERMDARAGVGARDEERYIQDAHRDRDTQPHLYGTHTHIHNTHRETETETLFLLSKPTLFWRTPSGIMSRISATTAARSSRSKCDSARCFVTCCWGVWCGERGSGVRRMSVYS